MKQLRNKNLYGCVRLAFVLFAILFSLLRQNITAIQPFLLSDIWAVALTLFAGILVLWDVFIFRNVFKMKYIWWLVAFFVLTAVSVLLNLRYGFMDSIKSVINLFIQFFALYVVCADYKRKQLNHELKIICNVLCVVWGIAAVISVYMFFADIFYHQTRYLWGDPVEIVQGFVRVHGGAIVMRLWGVFVDPNFAAAISVAAICFSLYIIFTVKNKLSTLLHVINIVFQFLYIVLSNSRMGYLILFLTTAVGAWYFAGVLIKKINWHWCIKELLAIVIAVVAVGICYAGVQTTKTVLPYMKTSIIQLQKAESVDETIVETSKEITSEGKEELEQQETIEKATMPQEVESLERQDIAAKSDISNGRFALWFDGLKVFLKHPVLGVGPRNHYTAAVEVVPDSLVAGGYSVHNSYLELLMGNGVLGFLVLLLYFILCAKDAVLLRYKSKTSCLEGFLMLAVLSLLASGMFIACLFYTLSGATVVLFAILGYAVKLMTLESGEK